MPALSGKDGQECHVPVHEQAFVPVRSSVPIPPIVGAAVGPIPLEAAIFKGAEHGKQNRVSFFVPAQLIQGLNREVHLAR